ncbi:hypothetical protein ANCDUO_20932, partial [Ancylostoma duodenale]
MLYNSVPLLCFSSSISCNFCVAVIHKALLSDLQHTTEVLRRANAASPAARNTDLEPIYQEQTKRSI